MKQIPILVDGAISVPLSKLRPIQGDLKELSNEDFVLLRTKILSGVRFVLHIWKEKETDDHWWIIDGHGRDIVFNHLVRNEQYEEPRVPCAVVKASNLEQAKRLVLDSSSTFHRIRPEGLRDYMVDLNMSPIDLKEHRLLEVNVPMFTREFFPETLEKKPETEEEGDKETVSFDAYKNSAIKQIMLLYSAEEYEIVVKKLEELADKFGVEDFSQVVWRLLAAQS